MKLLSINIRKRIDKLNLSTMSQEKIHNLVEWLNNQISHANSTIQESKKMNNYGREIQYEGIRDAFIRCLNRIKTSHKVSNFEIG